MARAEKGECLKLGGISVRAGDKIFLTFMRLILIYSINLVPVGAGGSHPTVHLWPR